MLKGAMLSACLTFASLACAFADEPAAPWMITGQCRMVVVPQKEAYSLITDFSDEAKCEEAWKRVQTLVENGQATLEADLVIKNSSGALMEAESLEEMRYPSEYEPPQLPAPDTIPKEKAAAFLKTWPVIGITPTAFETRKIGQTAQVSPTTSADGSVIDLSFNAQHIRFLRWEKYDGGRLATGERIGVEQPQFHVMKNAVNLQMRSGQKLLVGAHKMPGVNSASFELFLLTLKIDKAPGAK